MSHRYRLVPDPAQVPVLVRHCADARYVWNLALEQANCYRPGRPTPGAAERFRQVAEARQASWLGEGSSSVQQQALRDFDRALGNWWAGTHRRPTWRKAGVDEGFCVRDVTVRRLNRRWATVQVPKLGMVRSARGTVASPGTNVAAKRGLNRVISAQAWAMIRRRLDDKAATCAVSVVAVDPRGTSQRCAACGHTSPENRESQAVFRCRGCGHQANADINAAVNIFAAGLAVAARGGTPRGKGPDETRTQPVAA